MSGFWHLFSDLKTAKKPEELPKQTETPFFESELERFV
jgi:hypothetical protein